MANKMLIDAAHPEETRVVVVRGNRVEEFDYESANKKQLRGNIYLAKVTRVEPSLQAAFVDYGGNRHGFLAFNEIHPDYYQIPVADRNLLKEEEAREAAEQREFEAKQEELENSKSRRPRQGRTRSKKIKSYDLVEYISEQEGADYLSRKQISEIVEVIKSDAEKSSPNDKNENQYESNDTELDGIENTVSKNTTDEAEDESVMSEAGDLETEVPEEEHETDTLGSEDALEEVPTRPKRRRRKIYKIQEVIKRGQIILIQVVKEERGNKGAALTTYLSLAGRYTVLMPNTARGGGISRKITNIKDRKRLREIADNVDVPDGTGLIIRTAGASRTKAEIKRDFDYLLRLWENIRKYTLSSSAPTLIYEEGNLIKRSIRDLYSKEIDEVLVAGDVAYREAKDFMRLIMPSHAKNVHHYKEQEPLYQQHQVERQLNAMFNPQVKLKSGGYIVINQTEALVAIDVNSGKSTREFSIEETALNTNLEAATEVARQLRLRDLAGLIVIDFIDMDERKNNRAVEQMMKNSLKTDRARIQVGHISSFGLLEMSRQRLRTGVLEGSTTECPHCLGTGIIRSTESVALYVLRSVEDVLQGGTKTNLKANCAPDAALYILNYKRAYLKEIEQHYGITVTIEGNPALHGANFTIDKGAPALPNDDLVAAKDPNVVSIDWAYQSDDNTDAEDTDSTESARRKKTRRSRRRKPRSETESSSPAIIDDQESETTNTNENGDEQERGRSRKPRRRGRRGGRGRNAASRARQNIENVAAPLRDNTDSAIDQSGPEDKGDESAKTQNKANEVEGKSETSEKTKKTNGRKKNPKKKVEPVVGDISDLTVETTVEEMESNSNEKVVEPPKKRGWWQRRIS